MCHNSSPLPVPHLSPIYQAWAIALTGRAHCQRQVAFLQLSAALNLFYCIYFSLQFSQVLKSSFRYLALELPQENHARGM